MPQRRLVALLLWLLLPPAACKDSRSAVPISQAAPIAATVGTPEPSYFPPLALDSLRPDTDRFRSGWYGKALAAMAEPRLFVAPSEPSAETLRFLWLRTFHHPVAVRVERRPDGCGVTTTVLDGQGGYEPGAILRRDSAAANSDACTRIAGLMDLLWQAPMDAASGLDGAEWIFEIRRGSRYRVRSHWSPDSARGPAFLAAGRAFLALAKVATGTAEPVY